MAKFNLAQFKIVEKLIKYNLIHFKNKFRFFVAFKIVIKNSRDLWNTPDIKFQLIFQCSMPKFLKSTPHQRRWGQTAPTIEVASIIVKQIRPHFFAQCMWMALLGGHSLTVQFAQQPRHIHQKCIQKSVGTFSKITTKISTFKMLLPVSGVEWTAAAVVSL